MIYIANELYKNEGFQFFYPKFHLFLVGLEAMT